MCAAGTAANVDEAAGQLEGGISDAARQAQGGIQDVSRRLQAAVEDPYGTAEGVIQQVRERRAAPQPCSPARQADTVCICVLAWARQCDSSRACCALSSSRGGVRRGAHVLFIPCKLSCESVQPNSSPMLKLIVCSV